MTSEEYELMLSSKKLILKGKRWRKFHEFTAVPIFILICICLGSIGRINKVGFLEWQLIIFLIIPSLFLIWWIPYKNKELRFSEISTGKDKIKNYKAVKRALDKLGWGVKEKNENFIFIEAYTSPAIGLTWEADMITILIADNKILINSICNLEKVKNQAFFTFGKLGRNVKQFTHAVAEEI